MFAVAKNERLPLSRSKSGLLAGLTVSAMVAALVPLMSAPASADTSDYTNLDFVASETSSYDPSAGGGAYDDRTIGTDVLEQLQGSELFCGDIVTFFVRVVNDGSGAGAADDPETVRLNFHFDSSNASGADVGFTDVTQVKVNRGVIAGGVGEGLGGTDAGLSENLGGTESEILNLTDVQVGTPYAKNSYRDLTFDVSGIETGERIIVRMDVLLTCGPGGQASGNIQSNLESALVSATNTGTGEGVLNTGNQTIPLLGAGDVLEPALEVTKKVTTSTCANAVDTLSVNEGASVTYCYTVTNPGAAPLADVVLKDDNGTPANTADDVTITLTGLTDQGVGTAGPNDLAVGATATGTYAVTFPKTVVAPKTVTNIVTATGKNGSATLTATADAVVDILDVAPSVTIVKTVAPLSLPEPGGDFTYTLEITNGSGETVTITDLGDDTYDLGTECEGLIGDTLAAGASTSCEFTVPHTEPGTYTNIADVEVTDNDGTTATDTDDATATVTDVLPVIVVSKVADDTEVPETGQEVTFTFTVTNTGPVSVEITSLSDSDFTLTGDADCQIGTTLAAGASCSFTQTEEIAATDEALTAHENTFTAEAEDAQGNEASDDATETVEFTDVEPALEVTKSADDTTVPETGQSVKFTFVVHNTGTVPVTVTSLADSVFGTLTGDADCQVGTVLQPGAQCAFDVTRFIAADDDALTAHVNTFTAKAEDAQENEASDSDDETVSFTDVKPAITVTKTAADTLVPETGQDVTFTFVVENTGTVPVSITSLEDDVFGPLTGDADCQAGTVLEPGDSCSFDITEKIVATDVELTDHVNTFTAKAEDAQENEATDSDDATVEFEDVLPTVSLDKSADPDNANEPGETFTYTLTITNTGTVPVTIDELVDDKVDLSGTECADLIGTVLAPGDDVSCEFEDAHGNAGTYTNTADVTVSDAQGHEADDQDTETVYVINVAPVIVVDKVADPIELPEPGAGVEFTVTVTNSSESTDPVTITSIVDDVYGDLTDPDNDQIAFSDCEVGVVIEPGDDYTCSFVGMVKGDAGYVHKDTVTVDAKDDEMTATSDEDDATVTITDVKPEVSVTKTADTNVLDEPGGDVTFTVTITNESEFEDVTVTSIVDSVFGDLDDEGTCEIGAVLEPGGTYSCQFTRELVGDAEDQHSNTVTICAEDNESNSACNEDDEIVDFEDVVPTIVVDKTAGVSSVNEPGADVTYTVTVENTSVEAVVLDSLVDDKFGDLDGQGTCVTGGTIAVGATYSCTFTGAVTGNGDTTHTNTVDAEASDNEGNTATDSDDAAVDILDVLPTIQVDKTAGVSSVNEPGANVTYTVKVKNTSVEPVVLDALVDDKFGDLDGQGTCVTGGTIAVGATYTCTFTGAVTGNGDTIHTNTVDADATDDEGNTATDSDDAEVSINDVLPSITVAKDADVSGVPAGGGYVTYTVTITNSSVEDVVIDSLVDDKFGDLTTLADTTCATGGTIAPKGSYSCTFTEWISGEAGTSHVNVAEACVSDDETNPACDDDDETVDFTWRGRTPGYWKNWPQSWPTFSITGTGGAVVSPTTTTPVKSVFAVPSSWLSSGKLDLNKDRREDTLMDALGYKGGTDLKGAGQVLLRAATAGLLNEATFGNDYPPYATTAALLAAVNGVLDDPEATKAQQTAKRNAMIALAAQIDMWNNGIH